MSKAIEVVIREPRIGWDDWLVRLIAGLAASFISAWLVMLLTPLVFGFDVGYWQAFGFLILVRLAWPRQEFPHLRMSEKQKERKL